MITLQNEYLTAQFDNKGAELKSLISRENKIQYLWNGNAAFWPKHSPVLFPIVGSLVKDKYFYQGKEYSLPRHGFGREKDFTASQHNGSEVLFTLVDDESTLAVYPFNFNLGLRYKLTGPKLTCTYEVTNTGSEKMYFSIGGHPAFNIPLVPGTEYSDYYLLFNDGGPLVRHKLSKGLMSEETETLVTKTANTFLEETPDHVLLLHPELFYEDAIVLKDLESDHVVLGSDLHDHGFQFDFKGFPYLGIWAAKDAPFVCIEPWCGVSDSVNHNQQLEEKEGIVALEVGEKWERHWSVTLF